MAVIGPPPPPAAQAWWGWSIGEGTGAGHGIDSDLGLAHASAIKEAETDATKRALVAFANPFGLPLDDKGQRQVSGAKRRGDRARCKEEATSVQGVAATMFRVCQVVDVSRVDPCVLTCFAAA